MGGIQVLTLGLEVLRVLKDLHLVPPHHLAVWIFTSRQNRVFSTPARGVANFVVHDFAEHGAKGINVVWAQPERLILLLEDNVVVFLDMQRK